MNNKGFSLIELIVVITIMVILIAMLVPNFVGYITKTQNATAKSAANTIYGAAQSYVVSELAVGNTFEAGSTIDASVLYSDGVELITALKDDEIVEIMLNDTGTVIEYVYYENGSAKADYPEGASGKID